MGAWPRGSAVYPSQRLRWVPFSAVGRGRPAFQMPGTGWLDGALASWRASYWAIYWAGKKLLPVQRCRIQLDRKPSY